MGEPTVSSGPPSRPAVRRLADPGALARAAAEEFARLAGDAVRERGSFAVALAGGSTPRRLYALLADEGAPFRARVPWGRTHAFFGDERHVPPDHPDSNFRMASEALLSRVAVAGVHRIPAELPDPGAAAAAYEADLRDTFGLREGDPPPRLDLVLLGLGADGHTASLFPGNPVLAERERWVAAPWVDRLATHRITLTLPLLRRARAVVFLVSGAEKAPALARVLAPPPDAPILPAARVAREVEGSVLWLVDADAAG
jgi:6-phosphogluconolactonase